MTTTATITVLSSEGPATYKGRTVKSIVRRVYGQKAVLKGSADRNSPYAGQILSPALSGGSYVLATVLKTSGQYISDERLTKLEAAGIYDY